MSARALSVLLLAGLAQPALAQSFGDDEDTGIEIAPEKQIRFFANASADSSTGGRSRGRFGGQLDSYSLDASVTAAIPVDESTDATLTLGQTSTAYLFDSFGSFGGGRNDPIDYGLRYGLSGTITHAIDREWMAFGGAAVNSTGEVGADFDETLTFGGYAGLMYHVHEDLSVGVALGGFSQLEDDFSFFPVPTLHWQIDDYWRLVVGGGTTTGQPGAEITYHLNDAWEVGLSATYDRKQFRLEDDNDDVPGGVFEDVSVPIALLVTWQPEPNLKVSGSIGSMVYREVNLQSDTGDGQGEAAISPSFLVGIYAEYSF